MYLFGTNFTILTDNKALTFIQKCRLTSSRLTRWILAIQEYDFDIQHCKGKENIVADILSQNPTEISGQENMYNNEEIVIHEIKLTLSKNNKQNIKNIGKIQEEDEKTKIVQKK